MKYCSIIGCKLPHEAKGYCRKHYQRFKLHGDPNKILVNHTFHTGCTIKNCNGKHRAKGLCSKHYDHTLVNKKKLRRKYNKLECIYYYSGGTMKCACCGESIIEFLTINHDKNDGAKHRKEIFGDKYRIGGGNRFYNWLIKHKFPQGFSVMCWNCNSGSFYNGVCPHKR